MKKFGIIGTACSGKTTLCYEILANLKKAGIKCDGLVQTDCQLGFDRSLLDTDPLAQWALIAQQINLEAKMAMRTDIDVMICDRSPLDLYVYYRYLFNKNKVLSELVHAWCKDTFDCLYFMHPKKYEESSARCSEEFRDKMHVEMRSFFETYLGDLRYPHLYNASTSQTESAFVISDIKKRIGR